MSPVLLFSDRTSHNKLASVPRSQARNLYRSQLNLGRKIRSSNNSQMAGDRRKVPSVCISALLFYCASTTKGHQRQNVVQKSLSVGAVGSLKPYLRTLNKKPTNWLRQAKRCKTKIPPKAVGGGIFGRFFLTSLTTDWK